MRIFPRYQFFGIVCFRFVENNTVAWIYSFRNMVGFTKYLTTRLFTTFVRTNSIVQQHVSSAYSWQLIHLEFLITSGCQFTLLKRLFTSRNALLLMLVPILQYSCAHLSKSQVLVLLNHAHNTRLRKLSFSLLKGYKCLFVHLWLQGWRFRFVTKFFFLSIPALKSMIVFLKAI